MLSQSFLAINKWQFVQIILLPIFFVIIGIAAKTLGRRNDDKSSHVNDIAVGTSVILMTIGKIAADFSEILSGSNSKTSVLDNFDLFMWLLGLILVLLFFIYNDRFISWCKNETGELTGDKRLFVGAIIPVLVSTIIFIAYQAKQGGLY